MALHLVSLLLLAFYLNTTLGILITTIYGLYIFRRVLWPLLYQLFAILTDTILPALCRFFFSLGSLGVLWVRELFVSANRRRETAEQIQEIRRIGHQARCEMQQLYHSYMAQVREQKEG